MSIHVESYSVLVCGPCSHIKAELY